jgi:hypothetical protein
MHQQARANKDTLYLAIKVYSTVLYINCLYFEKFKIWLSDSCNDDWLNISCVRELQTNLTLWLNDCIFIALYYFSTTTTNTTTNTSTNNNNNNNTIIRLFLLLLSNISLLSFGWEIFASPEMWWSTGLGSVVSYVV